MTVSVYGFDDGYGDLKLYNGAEEILIPSFYTKWVPFKKSEFNREIDPYEHIKVTYKGQDFLVGAGAVKQDSEIKWVGQENKHDDEGFPILLNLALALMSQDNDEDEITVDPLVMGLPVKAEEDSKRHQQIEKEVIGEHKIKVELANGFKIRKTIIVESVVTKKQPFGSFCSRLLDDTGNVVNENMAEQYVVVSDIGAKTHNQYVLNGLDPVTPHCVQTNTGVFKMYREIQHAIEEKTQGFVPADGKLPEIVRDEKIGQLNLTKEVQNAKLSLANDVLNELGTNLGASRGYIEQFLFTGGGSEVLKKNISERFQSTFPMIKPEFLDRFATSRGLRYYGVMTATEKGKTVYQPQFQTQK